MQTAKIRGNIATRKNVLGVIPISLLPPVIVRRPALAQADFDLTHKRR
jgi:hypothetical protein